MIGSKLCWENNDSQVHFLSLMPPSEYNVPWFVFHVDANQLTQMMQMGFVCENGAEKQTEYQPNWFPGPQQLDRTLIMIDMGGEKLSQKPTMPLTALEQTHTIRLLATQMWGIESDISAHAEMWKRSNLTARLPWLVSRKLHRRRSPLCLALVSSEHARDKHRGSQELDRSRISDSGACYQWPIRQATKRSVTTLVRVLFRCNLSIQTSSPCTFCFSG